MLPDISGAVHATTHGASHNEVRVKRRQLLIKLDLIRSQ